MGMGSRRRESWLVFMFLAAWFILNLLFLTRFPLVHSDESWLAGLTRSMMESRSFDVTEPFFDLKPRYPHAIKILFHLMQMPFLAMGGYSAFSVRLLSLLAGAATLYLAYRCLRETASFRAAIGITAILSLDGQFLSAAHTGRQEILLLAAMLLTTLLLIRSKGTITPRLAVRLALVTGLSVGLHPNSFLLAAGCVLAMCLLMLSKGGLRFKPLISYIGVTGGIALCFVGLSLLLDRQFPAHYLQYGETEFDLNVPVAAKFPEFFAYIGRLWRGESGTYALPLLNVQLILIPPLLILGAVKAVRSKDGAPLAITGMALGAAAGTILIGRYNQLSAVLWMFPCLLLMGPVLSGARLKRIALPILAAAFCASTAVSVGPALAYRYEDYLGRISQFASPSETTLANLNTGFYFENGALKDIRNLSFLKENNLSFAEYVKSRGIRLILWPEEMDFIYRQRPNYNALYGNPRYVPEAEAFLEDHCTFLGEFEDGGYAVRIVSQLGKPYKVRAYRVNEP